MDTKAKRIAASLVDYPIVLGTAWLIEPAVRTMVSDIRSFPIAALPAILVMGSMAARGTSPGKKIFGLEIHSDKGVPGFGKGIVREFIRFLSLPVFVLPILYVVTWVQTGATPYDRFLGLSVVPAEKSAN